MKGTGEQDKQLAIPLPAFSQKMKADSATALTQQNPTTTLALLQPGLSGGLCWLGGPGLKQELHRYRNGREEQTKWSQKYALEELSPALERKDSEESFQQHHAR